MIFPGSIILAVLETMSYDTWLTITRFPCCVTYRQELADGLVYIGFIEHTHKGYKLSDKGEQFLQNYQEQNKLYNKKANTWRF